MREDIGNRTWATSSASGGNPAKPYATGVRQAVPSAGSRVPRSRYRQVGRMTNASNAETLLAVQLEQAGISFEREFRFAPPRRWRADFALYGVLLVEVDGGGFIAGRHSRGTGVEKDAEKQSAAAILGYRVIRCTPRQVENGTALDWIRQALGVSD